MMFPHFAPISYPNVRTRTYAVQAYMYARARPIDEGCKLNCLYTVAPPYKGHKGVSSLPKDRKKEGTTQASKELYLISGFDQARVIQYR
jgi:hypothetical protein